MKNKTNLFLTMLTFSTLLFAITPFISGIDKESLMFFWATSIGCMIGSAILVITSINSK